MAVPLLVDEADGVAVSEARAELRQQQQASQKQWLSDFDRRGSSEGAAAPAAAPAAGEPAEQSPWRRALGLLCVMGIPIFSTASTEFGQFIETRLEGGPYRKGYTIAWANHSVLIIFLIPWAMIVIAEKGCSCSALWKAMVTPYGSAKRLIGTTFC